MNWISVKDRLPDISEESTERRMIVYQPEVKHVREVWKDSCYFKKALLFHKDKDDDEFQITHWMPLPEPPKDK